jgi:predicted RND superfamily exporter protein
MNNLLIRFEYFLKSIFEKLHQYSKLTIFLTIFIFIFFSYKMTFLTQAVSIQDQMDPEIQSTKDIERLSNQFKENDSIGLIIAKKDLNYFTAKELCTLQLSINEIVYQDNEIESFISPFKFRIAENINGQLIYRRILKNPCENILTDKPELNLLQPLRDSPWNGLLTDNNQKDVAYNFEFRKIEIPTSFGHFDPRRVENFMNKIESKISHKVYWTGQEAVQYFTIKGLDHSQWLNILVIVIIWISLRFFFGTWKSGAIYITTLFFTASIVFGSMGIFKHSVDMLSSCLFLLIAISSLEDFIFVAQHQRDHNPDYIKSHLSLMTPSFFTSFTTILGFGSLIISDLSSIRHFGFYAALGSFVEWITVFFITPAFMKQFKPLQKWVDNDKCIGNIHFQNIVLKKPPLILSKTLLIVFIFAFFSIKHFRLSQTPSEMFPKDHIYQQMINYVRINRGWEANASIVFEKNINDKRKEELIKKFSKNPLIKKIESLSDTHLFLTSKIEDLKLKKLVIEEFNLSDFYKRFVAPDKSERVIIYLSTTNTEKINHLKSEIQNECPNRECFVAGEIIGFADFSKSLIQTLFWSLFLSLIMVGIVLSLLAYTKKTKAIWTLIVSSFWGPAVLLCLIYIFDISINFVTCIIASTLVGLTGDNAIQFIFSSNIDEGINSKGVSAFYCAFTMALCSLVFLGSYFDAPKTLGMLLAIGFLFSYLGDVWLLKGLTKK